MMAALFGTAAAQMVEIDSTSMTLVENTVAFPVDGFEFEMDTFTWTSEDERCGRRYENGYGNLSDVRRRQTPDTRYVWFVWFHHDWIVWRDERDDGVRSLQRHIEH
jgi:hypothetical protein